MSPPPGNFPPNTTRAIRHETIGPNGERVTVTWNSTNITIPGLPNQQPILPRPFPHPPGFALPPRASPGPPGDAISQILARARVGLQTTRQELDNVRVLLQGREGATVTTPPAWRIDRIRHHVQNLAQGLDQVQRDLASLVADPLMVQNQDVVTLQQSANGLRGHAENLNSMLDRAASEQASSTHNAGPSPILSTSGGTEPQPATLQIQTPQSTSTSSLATSGPELFILSSPQGPVGVLFDQRGTYSTAPMAPTLPFQAFTQQFSANRQLLAGIGQQLAQNSTQLHHQLAAGRPVQNDQAAAGAQPTGDQLAAENHNQNQNVNHAEAAAPVAEQDRLGIWAGHAWLIFKLACFIYLFAGNGGWYRPIMMGIAAAIVYLAQIGLFEEQFNRVRQHFEALLPLADRAGQNQGQNNQPQRTEPDRDLTPEQAAARLVQQHNDQRMGWVRQSLRGAERAFALFVASLWPGIGEGMVQAQEDRARAERQAEEERQRQEEEARQREADAQQAEHDEKRDAGEEKVEGPGSAEGPSESSTSSKGKEKVEVAEEGSSS